MPEVEGEPVNDPVTFVPGAARKTSLALNECWFGPLTCRKENEKKDKEDITDIKVLLLTHI